MKYIPRSKITAPHLRLILDTETHHDHKVIDDDGIYRWEPNAQTNKYRENISLNDLIPLLWSLGVDKNSELYRQLYRNMGYSLFGYWEIFYWEVNNPEAKNYKPNKK